MGLIKKINIFPYVDFYIFIFLLNSILRFFNIGSVYPFGCLIPSKTRSHAAWNATESLKFGAIFIYIGSPSFCLSTTIAIRFNVSIIWSREQIPLYIQFAII